MLVPSRPDGGDLQRYGSLRILSWCERAFERHRPARGGFDLLRGFRKRLEFKSLVRAGHSDLRAARKHLPTNGYTRDFRSVAVLPNRLPKLVGADGIPGLELDRCQPVVEAHVGRFDARNLHHGYA